MYLTFNYLTFRYCPLSAGDQARRTRIENAFATLQSRIRDKCDCVAKADAGGKLLI